LARDSVFDLGVCSLISFYALETSALDCLYPLYQIDKYMRISGSFDVGQQLNLSTTVIYCKIYLMNEKIHRYLWNLCILLVVDD
jgi:hypothetical protein